MSHFPVLVLSRTSQSVDDLLLPYMENFYAEPPVEFMEFYEEAANECGFGTLYEVHDGEN